MHKKGFTLIELLIVVAIIAILAAIAVPNFLEAQTRSKVARCKADMRSWVTGLEAYAVDNNKYPPPGDRGTQIQITAPVGSGFHSRLCNFITTPVAYCTTIFYDPFITNSQFSSTVYPPETRVGFRYIYYNTPYQIAANPNGDEWDTLQGWTGQWLIYGLGPDKTWQGGSRGTLIPYDATNGTVSKGNIVRSHKNVDGTPVHPRTGTFSW